MTSYYNENDPRAAAWLKELVAEGLIANGDIDTRSIADVRAADLVGYTQCHFFAGIGGWSYALRLSGWPDDMPVWTGSCPCQPFSAAGRRRGVEDERHLWPAWRELIAECAPPVCFGEQVASKAGRHWLASIRADMETLGYAVGAADLCAAGIGEAYGETECGDWLQWAIRACPDPLLREELIDFAAWAGGAISVGPPHLRQRLWFVAESSAERCQGQPVQLQPRRSQQTRVEVAGGSSLGQLDDGRGAKRGKMPISCERTEGRPLPWIRGEAGSAASQLVNSSEPGSGRHSGAVPITQAGTQRQVRDISDQPEPPGNASFWSDCDWLPCRDGKARPVEPGTFPLAHGVPNRVGLLRGYGNAIVPQVAAQFIGAYIDGL